MKIKTALLRKAFVLQLATVAALLSLPPAALGQGALSLDSCRSLALSYNKLLSMSRVNRGMAGDVQKAARTHYLPKVDAVGAYQLTSREVSLLSKSQKNTLNHLGDNVTGQLGGSLASALPGLVQQGTITAAQAQELSDIASKLGPSATAALNDVGQNLRKDFNTNSHNIFGADVMVRQPIYMGGALKAANKMADINVNMADDNIDLITQHTLCNVDQAYWLVVSLKQKQVLAQQYLDLVRKLHSDVTKLLDHGMTTKANELRVAVRVNEAEMTLTQVDDALSLSRMNLCQICGLDLNSDIRLADEDGNLSASGQYSEQGAAINYDMRPELRLLHNTVELSKQNTIVTRAAFLPQVFATGGYFFSNPNVLNGYRNNVSGLFHIGVTVRVPIWNWGEGKHRVSASKAATTMAELQYDEVKEKVELQVSQAQFRLKEAYKKLDMATSNLTSAEENLRSATLGFKEGMMQATDVMEAQTAWQQAHSQKIDAEIDVRLASVNLRKSLGTLK